MGNGRKVRVSRSKAPFMERKKITIAREESSCTNECMLCGKSSGTDESSGRKVRIMNSRCLLHASSRHRPREIAVAKKPADAYDIVNKLKI